MIVVKVLQAIIATEKPDLVVMGKQAVDGDANQVGQMLAGKLGWPQATFAASIEMADGGKSFLVGREVDGGVEYKRVPSAGGDHRGSPHRRLARGQERHHAGDVRVLGRGARLPSLKGIMAAKKKPMTVAKLGDYGAEPKPMIREVSVSLPPPRAAGQLLPTFPRW